tara:strand:+ start:2822 stop:4063 length:1242 start_codon:yes stop_codon:yes gene_type:complete
MKKNYKEINKCRISKSTNLKTILDLGEHYLTGVFPKKKDEVITKGPLELSWCEESGLVQLKHSFDPNEMYGSNYGYRSGLNKSMVEHLKFKVERLKSLNILNDNDVVLDIGSNDGTLLSFYKNLSLNKYGMDPTAGKFRDYYDKDITIIENFFSKDNFLKNSKNKKAKIVTSIAMFYDLEDPSKFVSDINGILDEEGIWHFEQSYLPTMLRMNSYDTICHEHVEYYTLNVVNKLLEKNDLKIINVELNSINGGSFAVTAAKKNSSLNTNTELVNWLIEHEKRMALNTLKPYESFKKRVFKHREDLKDLIKNIKASGKNIAGYGASTKGNVLLQFCDLSENEISCIAEVNKEKFGSFTPGTNIPIMSEEEVKKKNPDYMLVLPWHFRDDIIKREQEYLKSGGRLIFPLPEIEVI